MTTNLAPQLAPTNPAAIAAKRQAATDQQMNDILAGSQVVVEFNPSEPKFVPPPRNPYLAFGGRNNVNEYTVSYKNLSYNIKASSLLKAVELGYEKLVSNIVNFSKNNIKLSVQRKSKKRENHVYYFLAKREKIKNPNYKFKITFTKLKNNS